MKESCNLVLGNHDMHFLAIAEGLRRPFKNDTLHELLESENNAAEEFSVSHLNPSEARQEIINQFLTYLFPLKFPHWRWQRVLILNAYFLQ